MVARTALPLLSYLWQDGVLALPQTLVLYIPKTKELNCILGRCAWEWRTRFQQIFSWPNHFSVAGRPGVSINSGLRHGGGDLRASTTDSQGRIVRDSTEHRLTGRQFRSSRKQEPTMPGIVISCVRHNWCYGGNPLPTLTGFHTILKFTSWTLQPDESSVTGKSEELMD